jgi:hypothetical protein
MTGSNLVSAPKPPSIFPTRHGKVPMDCIGRFEISAIFFHKILVLYTMSFMDFFVCIVNHYSDTAEI